MAIEWSTIRGYFTDTDIEHMKQVSKDWPKVMDLSDCESTFYYARQIYDSVKSGRMPIGGTRWTEEMYDNFYDWWKNADPPCPADC